MERAGGEGNGGAWVKGGEMTQTLYAHINKIKIKKKRYSLLTTYFLSHKHFLHSQSHSLLKFGLCSNKPANREKSGQEFFLRFKYWTNTCLDKYLDKVISGPK
jgi:hypothetical protein